MYKSVKLRYNTEKSNKIQMLTYVTNISFVYTNLSIFFTFMFLNI